MVALPVNVTREVIVAIDQLTLTKESESSYLNSPFVGIALATIGVYYRRIRRNLID